MNYNKSFNFLKNLPLKLNSFYKKKSNSLSEIQGVLAHEIGHLVLNHHNSRSINKRSLSNYSKFASIAGIALSAVGKLDANSAIGLIVGSKDLATKSSLQFSRIQEQEFIREKDGYTSVKHQREVGTSYFDAVSNTISSGKSSTTAMAGSTESEQF